MLLFFSLIAFGAIARFVPHPANFAPIGALGIFAGLYANNQKQALGLPLIARFVSDALIGFFTPGVMISVYLSTAIGSALGFAIRKKKNIFTIFSATVAGSILFFIITNFAVWLFDGYYPMNLHGLIKSYTMAVPFFRNSLLGDLFYTGVLVGGYELALQLNFKFKTLNFKQIVNSKQGE